MPATALSRSQMPPAPNVIAAGREISLAEFVLVLGDTRLPLSAALYTLGSIARAISDAHQSGKVHGRLEPSMVMLGGDGSVRVEWPKPGARLVPAYAAPELGPNDTPDVLADIYAIGAIAYELLTGRLVPAGQAQPPSAFNPGVDPTVDELVLIAIDREPDQRPYAASALMSGVAHCFRELDMVPNPDELGRLVRVMSPTQPSTTTATHGVPLARMSPPSPPKVNRAPGRPLPAPKRALAVVDDDDAGTGDNEIPSGEYRAPTSKAPWVVGGVLVAAVAALVVMMTSGGSSKTVEAIADEAPVAASSVARPLTKVVAKAAPVAAPAPVVAKAAVPKVPVAPALAKKAPAKSYNVAMAKRGGRR